MEIYSRGGVPVYSDYHENIIIDLYHPILGWKANKEKFNPNIFPSQVRELHPEGLPRIGSRHSEDALTWNVFRSLQLTGNLRFITDFITPRSDFDIVFFWARDSSQMSNKVAPDIQECLDRMEPWGKGGSKQQTETDVILCGKRGLVMVECKLGKPKEAVRAWCRSSPGMRPEYQNFMKELSVDLFSNSFDYQKDGNRFYQLFRNYLLGAALASKWRINFSLLTIVNSLNTNLEGRSHADEFRSFQDLLQNPSNTFLMTWQEILGHLHTDIGLSSLQTWLANYPFLQSR